MSPILIVEILALILLFACSAFFSSAETAMFSMDTIRLNRIRRTKPKAVERIEQILKSPTKLLSTILIGNMLVNVAASEVGYAIAEKLIPRYAEAVTIPVMIVLLLLLGEVTPKRVAIRRPERIAAAYSRILWIPISLLSPFRLVVESVTRVFKKHIELRRKALSEDEFMTALVVGEEEGVIDKEERSMLSGIIRLADTRASDVMTPRVDLVGIDLEDDSLNRTTIVRNSRFRYLPVYRRTLDNIESLLDVAKFLLNADGDIGKASVPPLFVPETATLNSLLAGFQKDKRRAAVVVDEYGGTAGLVTRSDILEEVVAYVDDEASGGEPAIEPAGRNCWLVNGTVSLEDLNRKLDLNLQAEGVDRVAGWVIARVGRIPRIGESVHAENCSVTVKRLRKNRIVLVSVQKDSGTDGRGIGS